MSHFQVTFRGYDRAQVDAFVERIGAALASEDPARHTKAAADAQAVSFKVVLRGYDPPEVDNYLRRVAKGRAV